MDCPVCREHRLEPFFETLGVPVFCNVLHETREDALAAARGDVRLGACPGCGTIHNVAFDPALVEYAAGYENSLHGSPRFDEWARGLARRLAREHHLEGGELLEVGAGRGEFLALLCEAANARGVGYEPSAPPEALGERADGVRILPRMFDPAADPIAPDLVLSRHVLEHVRDPRAFVRTLVATARRAEHGALYLEVPNGLWTLRDLGVWDVIYEHCSYFVPCALRELLRREGVGSARLREEFGGQFLAAQADPRDEADGERGDARELDELAAHVGAFARAFEELLDRWRGTLEQAAAQGRGVAVWGAGSKGVTFANLADEAGALRCMVDVNPLKHGRFVAGAGLEVLAPADALARELDLIVVMNPLYQDEIDASLRRLGWRGETVSVG